MDEDFFATACDSGDGLAGEELGKIGFRGMDNIGPQESDVGDGQADESRAKGANHGFDFGEFGHSQDYRNA